MVFPLYPSPLNLRAYKNGDLSAGIKLCDFRIVAFDYITSMLVLT
uniref:Uncharacterized protein n=1 Tax=Anguilla anguilla TaxID=7936 RepID=A0A0E9RKH7_ANGAN